MSHAPVREIAKSLADLSQKGRKLGFPPGLDPFLALGFMSLPVIPRLKLTSAGLVEDFKIVSLILAG
jgi:adenine deaminase